MILASRRECSPLKPRVEDIAAGLSLADTPDFSALRTSIDKLQAASAELDQEKLKAEKHFKKALRKLEKRMRKHSGCRHRGKWLRRARSWVKRVFGVDSAFAEAHRAQMLQKVVGRVWAAVSAGDDEVLEALQREHGHGKKGRHGGALKEFIRAAMRVRKANQKLIAFERGFIDEAGIKDREWYRHLGVAPGKWLGT